MLTNACNGLRHDSGRIDHKHEWCQGFGFRLVPGQVEYATQRCDCICHGGTQ